MESASSGGRRRMSLSDQMAVLDKSNLRDLLRVRDEDDGRSALAGLTLGAVLGCEEKTPASRSLIDILKHEDSSLMAHNNKKNWKSFKDRLRLRRMSGAAWTSSSSSTATTNICLLDSTMQTSDPIPVTPPVAATSPAEAVASVRPENSSASLANLLAEHNFSSSEATAFPNQAAFTRLAAALAAEREMQRSASNAAAPTEARSEEIPSTSTVAVAEAPGRVSLMALLEETDRQAGVVGSTFVTPVEDGGGEYVDDDDGGEYACCVCMVRHKGAAFIPCGHTFCRLCSREVWVNRGNCPLCNGFILEILDIF
ncbi:PREDICTED: uncharacterized protein LOC104586010 [Nelumbo nucifera]|uniref:Uncharacterized protein LOC104586010 n=1 Tax=Nelumbo nucifera TaxID=4432 RepID=A0A1U7YR19_NELNU|nr:PREDICTED: uncharacterized protein LOC104586010 [Nelumbo nucifera]